MWNRNGTTQVGLLKLWFPNFESYGNSVLTKVLPPPSRSFITHGASPASPQVRSPPHTGDRAVSRYIHAYSFLGHYSPKHCLIVLTRNDYANKKSASLPRNGSNSSGVRRDRACCATLPYHLPCATVFPGCLARAAGRSYSDKLSEKGSRARLGPLSDAHGDNPDPYNENHTLEASYQHFVYTYVPQNSR